MRRNLADPAYEPSDDELRELSKKAFEHVPQSRRETHARLRADIARMRAEVLKRLREAQPSLHR